MMKKQLTLLAITLVVSSSASAQAGVYRGHRQTNSQPGQMAAAQVKPAVFQDLAPHQSPFMIEQEIKSESSVAILGDLLTRRNKIELQLTDLSYQIPDVIAAAPTKAASQSEEALAQYNKDFAQYRARLDSMTKLQGVLKAELQLIDSQMSATDNSQTLPGTVVGGLASGNSVN